MHRSDAEVRALLALWGLEGQEITFIDSSHGEDDVRENYIIDRRWVLRVHSADVMSDARLADLNRLIGRYRDFGLCAPLFLPLAGSRFLHPLPAGGSAYLSEYLDMQPADQAGLTDPQWRALDARIVEMTARFAARYRGVDLSDTYGMYSLFDLCPYDRAAGMDEKQENCNGLAAALTEAGEGALAREMTGLNDKLRRRLLDLYPRLTKCVFQGDENGSNLCLDGAGNIRGIFDFNMAGTDVCVNYLANHAPYLYDPDLEQLIAQDGEALFAGLVEAARAGTRIIRAHYPMTGEEEQAYPLYMAIVALFQWPLRCDYEKGIKHPDARAHTLGLLRRIMEAAGRLA